MGNLRLQSDSPCINSGLNAAALRNTDLDGLPRISGATVDVGAYEFQNPAGVLSYAWLAQFGFVTDGSVDYADSDGDTMSNWREWIAGTTPINALSSFRLVYVRTAGAGTVATWTSVTNRLYSLERSADLAATPAFSLLRGNIAGLDGTTSSTESNATGTGRFFSRAMSQAGRDVGHSMLLAS